MISIYSLVIILLINFFIIGIKFLSIKLFFRYKILSLKNNINSGSNYAIASLIGVFLFCIFSNLVLALPSLLFFISNSLFNFENVTTFLINFLKILFILISLLGFLDLVKINPFIKKRLEDASENEFSKDLILSLLTSTLIYIFIAPKTISSGIIYDTGLYHLPLVNHLSNFAIEPGLANLHVRYGFYGLSFFGQVPINSFNENIQYISPSINIGFMAIYFSYYLPYLRTLNVKKFINTKFYFKENTEEISSLYFLISIIFYTGGIFKSLSSYSLDLPLFICGSMTFHLLLVSFFISKNNFLFYIPILLLSFFSTLIKLTGIIVPIYFLIFLIIKILLINIKKVKFKNINNLREELLIHFNQKDYLIFIKKQFNYKLTIFLVATCILVFLLTNLIITGFPFFPLKFWGPIHQYSLDLNSLKELSIDTLNWHRYQGNIDTTKNWIYIYLLSRNGLLNVMFWFIPSLLTIINLWNNRFNKYKFLKVDFLILFAPLLIIQIICFNFLIPLVNYYPWLVHCSIFLMILTINRSISYKRVNINFVRLTFLALLIFIFSNSFLSYSNREILLNINQSILKEPFIENPSFDKYELKPEKWVSLKNLTSKKINVSIPNKSEQCWGIKPPCTYSKNLLKDL